MSPANVALGLSKRALAIGNSSIQQELLASWVCDEYDSIKNPHGIINLGSSLNTITSDLMENFIHQSHRLNPEKVISPNRLSGSLELCQCLADFFNRHFKPRQEILSANIFCANGISALIEAIMFALGDENEAILMPTPGFELLTHAIEMRSSVRCVFADTEHLEDQFSSLSIEGTVNAFENAIEDALKHGLTVKSIFLCNPHNPVGRCYEPAVLRAVMRFCKARSLHLVVDEIYAFSAIEDRFHSSLTIDEGDVENVHVLYGVGKDWALCGARLACMISRNTKLLSVLNQTARFTRASSLPEQVAMSIFADSNFTDSVYIPTLRRRLCYARAFTMDQLKQLNIPFIEPNASFGIWIDLSHFVNNSFSRNQESKEVQLTRHLLTNGVILMPSQAFTTEDFGFFRLNYSVDKEMLRVGIHRLRVALEQLEIV